jgi:hypothetical protein
MDDAVWDRTVFSINRDRLLGTDVARRFFRRVLHLAAWQGFVSDEHISVDGTMIEAWASHKSLVPKNDSGPDKPAGRNPEADFKGKARSNATHQSRTDPQARLYKKDEFAEAKLRHRAHALAGTGTGCSAKSSASWPGERTAWPEPDYCYRRARNPCLPENLDQGRCQARIAARQR